MRFLAAVAAMAAATHFLPASAVTLDIPSEATGQVVVETDTPLCDPPPCTINNATLTWPAQIEPISTTLSEVTFRWSAPPGMAFVIEAPGTGSTNLNAGMNYTTGNSFGTSYTPDGTSLSFERSRGTAPTNVFLEPNLREAGNQFSVQVGAEIVGDFRFVSMIVTMTGTIPALEDTYTSEETPYFGLFNDQSLPQPEFLFIRDVSTLAPVPLPAAGPLLFFGFAGLIALRRRAG